jgi:hypothetical protein
MSIHVIYTICTHDTTLNDRIVDQANNCIKILIFKNQTMDSLQKFDMTTGWRSDFGTK